ncbi:MAG: zinc-ribbon domain-containing protein [Candidatus Woesearchaeota archaeon]
MAKIPPVIFIGLGGIVLTISLFNRELILFVLAGFAFLVYGFIGFVSEKKPKQRRVHHPHAHQQPLQKRCHHCGHVINARYRFCPHCGAKNA